MLATLKKKYAKEQFKPGLIGLFTNPFYFDRRGLYKAISARIHTLSGKILDVGCGNTPYKQLVNCTEYVGLEIDTPNSRELGKADYFYKGREFPFADSEFDSILSNQVMEHVFDPHLFLSELNRVLKISEHKANLLLSVPLVWEEHEQPYDYGRYSSFGLRHILENHGFEVVELHKSSTGFEVVFQLAALCIYKRIVGKNPYLNLLYCLLFIAPVNAIGSALCFLLPNNTDLYLENIVLAKKIKNIT